MNVTAPLRRLARMIPHAPALVLADGTVMDYAALDAAIDAMAHYAMRAGLRAGAVAGFDMPPDDAPALVLSLALARIGVASASPDMPGRTMRFAHGRAAPGDIHFDAAWMRAPPGPWSPPAIHADTEAICRVFTSSGTTGTPKYIPISHALMTRRVHSRVLSLGGGPVTRMIAVGFGLTRAVTSMLLTWWQGGTIVLYEPGHAAAALRRHRVGGLVASPRSLQHLAEAMRPEDGRPPDLRVVEVAGSALPAPVRRLATARLCGHIVSYLGAAESAAVASLDADALEARPGAAGYVWPDIEVQAVDGDDAPLPPGTEGVVRIRGDVVAAGYLGDPAATAQSFRDGWFYPGDFGTLWPDGMLTLNGRVSDVINLGGDKVNPYAAEQALLTLPAITDAAVFGVPDERGLTELWAAVVADAPLDAAVLDAHCRAVLPRVTVATVVQLAALPRDANGKMRRDQLVRLASEIGG